MYTPRGELNEKFLQALYQGKLLDEMKLCRKKTELMKLLGNYAIVMPEEELLESLAVIQSYLDEEQKMRLLEDEELDEVVGGAQKSRIFCRDQIVGLLEKKPGAADDLRGLFSVLRR